MNQTQNIVIQTIKPLSQTQLVQNYYQISQLGNKSVEQCSFDNIPNQILICLTSGQGNIKVSEKETNYSQQSQFDTNKIVVFKQNGQIINEEPNQISQQWNIFFHIQNILKLTLSFLDIQDLISFGKTSNQNKLLIRQLLLSKILLEEFHQEKFWQGVINYKYILRNKAAYYDKISELVQQQSEYSRDLDRTFLTEQIQSLQGQVKLNRILRAFDSTVGYFQGLNYIAAAFLFKFSEQKSYWFIRFLLNKINFIQTQTQIFDQFMKRLYESVEKEIPIIYEHIESMELDLKYFATKWILTLFSYDCSIQIMLKLWELIIISDDTILISFIINVLYSLQKQILECQDGDELNELLKSDLKTHLNSYNKYELFQATIKKYNGWNQQTCSFCIYDETVDEQIIKNPTIMG